VRAADEDPSLFLERATVALHRRKAVRRAENA
jgi:hypothetical protein